MAKISFTNNQDYHYRYADFDDYRIAKINTKTGVMKLVYDAGEAGQPFDADRSPWSINVTLKAVTTFKPSQGEYKGEKTILSGNIQKIEWFNKGGKLQVKMIDIDLDAGVFHHYLRDEPWSAYGNLVSGGSTFSGPGSGNRGMDVKTGSGNDVVKAGPGGSYIKDFGGKDRYVGSNGDNWDTVSYDQWYSVRLAAKRGIEVDLAKGYAIGPDGLRDKLVDIERVGGTVRKDVLKGSVNDDAFFGGRGADVIDGRGGDDRIQYYKDEQDGGYDGIHANLITGRVRDGFGTVDRVSRIEEVEGTDVRDTFIGNEDDNWFRGRDGADVFVFKGKAFGSDTIDDFSRKDGDKISIGAAKNMADLSITKNADGTYVEFTDAASIWLDDWTAELKSSDFIF
ncbi:hypothetical protein [Tropicimonas marinistellae]|uniref:hypothetical protein n=1 Tax=Tropicimonas marinistellae TaxID=1739787 RepID=UPI00082EC328|nr:hypothetical protein [Tropicimonas marinistellae]